MSRRTRPAHAVKGALNDPAPQNRFQAAEAFGAGIRGRPTQPILDALAGRMGVENDPAVRRGFSETIYNVLDENEGQLAAWERAMVREEDRKLTDAALHANRREQSEILARRLEQGNRQARHRHSHRLVGFPPAPHGDPRRQSEEG